MFSQINIRFIKNFVRSFNTSAVVYANHYDVLGITPRATQNDIKSAYYELSKKHHPDKSSDEESAKKFRAISEAYEVLGNVNLKKMYDKGLLTRGSAPVHPEYKPEPEPTDPTLRFYKSRASRHITPTMDGKVPIYDFDAWSKNHYADVFKKAQYDKDLLRKIKEKQSDTVEANKQEATIYIIFMITLLFVACLMHGESNYDIDKTRTQDIQPSNSKTPS